MWSKSDIFGSKSAIFGPKSVIFGQKVSFLSKWVGGDTTPYEYATLGADNSGISGFGDPHSIDF